MQPDEEEGDVEGESTLDPFVRKVLDDVGLEYPRLTENGCEGAPIMRPLIGQRVLREREGNREDRAKARQGGAECTHQRGFFTSSP